MGGTIAAQNPTDGKPCSRRRAAKPPGPWLRDKKTARRRERARRGRRTDLELDHGVRRHVVAGRLQPLRQAHRERGHGGRAPAPPPPRGSPYLCLSLVSTSTALRLYSKRQHTRRQHRTNTECTASSKSAPTLSGGAVPSRPRSRRWCRRPDRSRPRSA